MSLLNVQDISRTYPQGGTKIVALKDISFQLEKGETLAIVGSSGSGKTTLLSLLAGLDTPTSGKVFIDGHEVTALDEAALSEFRAQNMGIVFQQFHLMPHLSAFENVCLPLEIVGAKNIEARAMKGLVQVGLKDRAHHRPDQLSGGECQRVAIARSLVGKPKLLLADEPSGNLDTETGDIIMRLLFDLVQKNGMTLVLVTHNPEHAKLCQRTLVLKAGQMK